MGRLGSLSCEKSGTGQVASTRPRRASQNSKPPDPVSCTPGVRAASTSRSARTSNLHPTRAAAHRCAPTPHRSSLAPCLIVSSPRSTTAEVTPRRLRKIPDRPATDTATATSATPTARPRCQRPAAPRRRAATVPEGVPGAVPLDVPLSVPKAGSSAGRVPAEYLAPTGAPRCGSGHRSVIVTPSVRGGQSVGQVDSERDSQSLPNETSPRAGHTRASKARARCAAASCGSHLRIRREMQLPFGEAFKGRSCRDRARHPAIRSPPTPPRSPRQAPGPPITPPIYRPAPRMAAVPTACILVTSPLSAYRRSLSHTPVSGDTAPGVRRADGRVCWGLSPASRACADAVPRASGVLWSAVELA
jgi:hypothetical protein